MKISARNVLRGKVKSMVPGAVNSEVVVELPAARRLSRSSPRAPPKTSSSRLARRCW